MESDIVLIFHTQLDVSERKCSLLELDMKNLRRCLETREQELNMLKEEVSCNHHHHYHHHHVVHRLKAGRA